MYLPHPATPMRAPYLTGTNPVLARELRVSLRTAKTFLLLAVYVAILGAIVVSQFPSDTYLNMGAGHLAATEATAAQRGRDLFGNFCAAQVILVLILFPALATGMIGQERERRTLEPLLLTPLTPLQIIWGKAGGVLCLAVLLLLSTLPLTSLCFLLGGVSPQELVAAYTALLGLALLTISLGLYCAAKWTNSTRATLYCYLWLPVVAPFIVIFAPIGTALAGLYLIGGSFSILYNWWRRQAAAPLPRRLGPVWWVVFGILALGLFSLLIILQLQSGVAILYLSLSLTAYFFYLAYLGLQQAARELAQRPDPIAPLRTRVHDFKAEWERAVASPQVVYMPSPTGEYKDTAPITAPPPALKPLPVTYGVKPFLADNLNPVFARDLRAGLVGKIAYLLRFSYIAIIGTELLLLGVLLLQPDVSETSVQGWFAGWAYLHMLLLMVVGAWLGARSIAPEREQQTLPQLLTTPLTAHTIVHGKIMAVMVHTFYVFILGVPLALFLPALKLVPWSMALNFVVLELSFGVAAASWGLFCSVHGHTMRRALGLALGGIVAMVMGNVLLWSVVDLADIYALPLFPFKVMEFALTDTNIFKATDPILRPAHYPLYLTLETCLVYGLGTLMLLYLTAYAFKRYAQTA